MDQSTERRFSSRAVVVMSATIALVASGVGAWANHQFTDVPSDHVFHEEIDAIADAGISTGYPDGTYRPGRDVSRGAMAAFMARTAGRVGETFGLATLNSSGTTQAPVASIRVESGAAGSGNGFVHVSAQARFNTADAANCPCQVRAWLRPVGSGSGSVAVTTLGGAPDESGLVYDSLALEQVFPISGNHTQAYELVVDLQDDDVGDINARGDMTATYVPLGPDGDDTLDFELE